MADTTLVQEDGTGKTDSNSYATTAELTIFANDRNVTLTGTYGDATEILYKAMDFIEQVDFQGRKYTQAQALQFPRSGVEIDGYVLDATVIPTLLKESQMALAVAIDQGYDPLANIDREQKRIKVDVIEIEYMDSAAPIPIAQLFLRKIRKLVSNQTGGSNFQVRRG